MTHDARLRITTATGESRAEVALEEDTTLREAAYIAKVPVYDRCGGVGSCGNCVIRVLDGAEHINAKTPIEAATFYLQDGERLSCQCRVITPGATVTICVP